MINEDDDVEHNQSQVDIQSLNPSAAALAANEEAFIDNIHSADDHRKQEEVADWVGSILGEKLDAQYLFDELNDGVRLLHLAKAIQLVKSNHFKDSAYLEAVKQLQPDEYSVTHRGPPNKASLIAKQRSNIAKFLEWCGDMGVPYITLFETEDLTHQKNLRQVTTCLFYVSKIASRFGIEPPSSVKEEMKMEEAIYHEHNAFHTVRKISVEEQKALFQYNAKSGRKIEAPILEDEENDIPNSVGSDSSTIADVQPDEVSSLDGSYSHMNICIDRVAHSIDSMSPNKLDLDVAEDQEPIHQDNTASQDLSNNNYYIPGKNVEVTEVRNMTIAEEFHFRPVQVPTVDRQMSDEDAEKHSSSFTANMNAPQIDTTVHSAGLDYYHGDFNDMTYDDNTYEFTYLEDISEDEEQKVISPNTYRRYDEPLDVPHPVSSSFEEITEIQQREPSLDMFLIPADIGIEGGNFDVINSSDESTTEVLSYCSNDDERRKTFADIAVGSNEPLNKRYFEEQKKNGKPLNEIMINFPPYFEFTSSVQDSAKVLPPQEYFIAPVQQEPLYAVSKKSRSRKQESHTNEGLESENGSRNRSPIGYRNAGTSSSAFNLEDGHTSSHSVQISQPRPSNHEGQMDMATQTHVSYTHDVMHIIGKHDKYSRPGFSGNSTPTRNNEGSRIIRTRYQNEIHTSDEDVYITQVSSLDGALGRWGSVTSSTRVRNTETDVESIRPVRKPRQNIIRRASSRISQRFEKAAILAKKYQKQIIIIVVLLLLTAGALAAMVSIFPNS